MISESETIVMVFFEEHERLKISLHKKVVQCREYFKKGLIMANLAQTNNGRKLKKILELARKSGSPVIFYLPSGTVIEGPTVLRLPEKTGLILSPFSMDDLKKLYEKMK